LATPKQKPVDCCDIYSSSSERNDPLSIPGMTDITLQPCPGILYFQPDCEALTSVCYTTFMFNSGYSPLLTTE